MDGSMTVLDASQISPDDHDATGIIYRGRGREASGNKDQDDWAADIAEQCHHHHRSFEPSHNSASPPPLPESAQVPLSLAPLTMSNDRLYFV